MRFVIARPASIVHRLRNGLNRSRRNAFGVEAGKGTHAEKRRGLVIIQIDGLGYDQLTMALKRGRLPFLKTLLDNGHTMHRMYSGLPSTTPAAQAELFYGVRGAVPAFHYIRRSDGADMHMLEPQAVNVIAADLEEKAEGLLSGGNGYGNIFVGGADEARFCTQGMDLQSIFQWRHPVKTLLILFSNLDGLLRTAGLALLESLIAAIDFFQRVFDRKNILQELRFIPSRIWVGTVLRELLRLHVKMDIATGEPIIHANFVGYDEHAHRRGPASAIAHLALKGIDGVIRDIAGAVRRADQCCYQLLIYSDHGQEAALPFEKARHKSFHRAIKRVFAVGPMSSFRVRAPENDIPYGDLHLRGINLLKNAVTGNNPRRMNSAAEEIRLTAMGPLSHLYLPRRPNALVLEEYARRLVLEAGVPLVLFNSGAPRAMTAKGLFQLDGREWQPAGAHPFGKWIMEDLQRIVLHRDAGDYVLSGWRQGERPITFPMENGAHGGPGSRETCAFLVVPHLLAGDVRRWRPAVLRRRILAFKKSESKKRTVKENTEAQNKP